VTVSPGKAQLFSKTTGLKTAGLASALEPSWPSVPDNKAGGHRQVR